MYRVRSVLVMVFTAMCSVSGEYFGEDEGDLCDTELPGVVGVCTQIYQCDYAKWLVNEKNMSPEICSSNTTHTIVCCPSKRFQTGILGQTFMDSLDGRLSNGDIECRYTGKMPLICCKRVKEEVPLELETRFSQNLCGYQDYKISNACMACRLYSSSRRLTSVCPQETSVKIADGEPADIQEYPHMVVLGCRHRDKKNVEDADIVWVAGGTLISYTYVLTAAHALYSTDYGNIEFALLGATDKSDIKNGILTNIISLEHYPLYSSAYHEHDIALVQLDTTIPITMFTRPACLPVPSLVPDKIPSAMKVAGWGKVGQHLNASRILKKGDMYVQRQETCLKSLQTSMQRWNSSISICAKSETADTCYGDSGGPLMIPMEKNSLLCGYLVMGVVSYGSVCGQGQLGAYVNVSYYDYLEWIVSTVWKNRY